MKRRRNLDFFTDASGVHPVRGSRGYTEWMTGSMKAARMRAGFKKKLAEQARRRAERVAKNPSHKKRVCRKRSKRTGR